MLNVLETTLNPHGFSFRGLLIITMILKKLNNFFYKTTIFCIFFHENYKILRVLKIGINVYWQNQIPDKH